MILSVFVASDMLNLDLVLGYYLQMCKFCVMRKKFQNVEFHSTSNAMIIFNLAETKICTANVHLFYIVIS